MSGHAFSRKSIMTNKRTLQLVSATIICMIGLTAFAQDGHKGTTSGKSMAAASESSSAQAQSRDMRASNLLGKDVRNAQGENMGKIDDLVIDPVSRRAHYVVLSFGGVLGMGDKLFAFPVNAFEPSRDQDELVLNVEKERLKNAPGFDRSNWPDFGDNRYRGDVDRYHKAEPAERGAFKDQLMRASELIGREVKDGSGRDAGEIEDLVVNMRNAQVRYVVLDLDKAWSQKGKMVALPLKTVTFPRNKDKDLVLNVPEERIDMSRGFDEKSWPDLNDAKFRQDQENYLSTFDTGRGIGLAKDASNRQTSSGASSAGPSTSSVPSHAGPGNSPSK
jgi:sporulation protein YlmC with PRC-barrel domain